MEYEYFENDGAYFRARANTALACVDEVWTADGWKPYAGDRGKPYSFGNRVTEFEVQAHVLWLARHEAQRKATAKPEFAPGEPSMLGMTTARMWLALQAGDALGRAFQIIGAPKSPKPR
jgi:hypothetical protein